jgi:Carboxypeptidase regulatory-like domain
MSENGSLFSRLAVSFQANLVFILSLATRAAHSLFNRTYACRILPFFRRAHIDHFRRSVDSWGIFIAAPGLFVFWTALLLLSIPTSLSSQAVNGTLLGTVTDPSGAVVPNASVTVVLVGQSVEHTAVTNESGNFPEPDLPSGT